MLKTIKLIIILSKSLALTTLTKRFYPKGGKDIAKHAVSLVPKTPGAIPNVHQSKEDPNTNPKADSALDEPEKKALPDIEKATIPTNNILEIAHQGNKAWISTTMPAPHVVTNYGAGAGITAALATMQEKKIKTTATPETVDDFVGIPVNPFENVIPIIIPPVLSDSFPTVCLDNDSGSFFVIPSPPPLPVTSTHQVIRTTDELRAKGLLDDKDQLTKTFHVLKKTTNNVEIPVIFSEEEYDKKPSFGACLLIVHDVDNTICLDSKLKHVNILYESHGGQIIAWGYLTSEKGNPKVSDSQPFALTESEKKKSQHVCIFDKPFIITEKDISVIPDLDPNTFQIIDPSLLNPTDKASLINQNLMLTNYMNQEAIQKILKELFDVRVKPKLTVEDCTLPLYDGKGVTLEELNHALLQIDIIHEKRAQKLFMEYKEKKNHNDPVRLTEWLDNIESRVTEAQIREMLKEKINEYENKYK